MNDIFALIGLTFIPILVFFILLKLFVSGQKFRYLFLAIVMGLIAVLPAAFVQYYFRDAGIFNTNEIFYLLLTAVLFNGLIEEGVKTLFLGLVPQKKLTLGAFLSTCLMFGLTFGTLESVVYLVNYIQQDKFIQDSYASASEALKFVFLRMGTAVALHSACSVLGGLFWWKWRHKSFSLMPFLYAIVLHGIYNYFACMKGFFWWLSIVALLFAVLECRVFYTGIVANENPYPVIKEKKSPPEKKAKDRD